jgi:dTDP-glucose 4,6-dehydratase
MSSSMKLLITGGMGFIGSNFVRYMLANHHDYRIINLDKLGYGSNPDNLRDISNPNYRFLQGDISNITTNLDNVDIIVNFAAETHVDRSISNPQAFLANNTTGMLNLLEICRRADLQFLQVSTDEVYGSSDGREFNEEDRLNPSSPYAASKAAADMLTNAYHKTYGLRSYISRCTNNYGPCQSPEKFIPKIIIRAILGRPIPIYGSGMQIRDWIHVRDHCSALDRIIHSSKHGEIYNVGSRIQVENINVAKQILTLMGKPHSLIEHVQDRPGHDIRYRLDTSKIQRLGWRPMIGIDEGLNETASWYLQHASWWNWAVNEKTLSPTPWKENW